MYIPRLQGIRRSIYTAHHFALSALCWSLPCPPGPLGRAITVGAFGAL